jgi:hypothetical protein
MKKPYMQFYFRDHLGSLKLRQCHLISKAIWWDLQCWMGQGEPYGHLRIEPVPYVSASPHGRAHARGNGGPDGIPFGPPDGTPHGLLQTMTPPGKDGSLEPCLPALLGQPKQVVEWAIADLEAHRVFSRTATGVIFCRRMVRDQLKHDVRVQNALEAYKKRVRRHDSKVGMGNQGAEKSHRSATAPPNGTDSGAPNGIPSGVPPAPPHAPPHAPASGTPHAPPNGTAQIPEPDILRRTPPTPPSGGNSRPRVSTRTARQADADAAILKRLEERARGGKHGGH